MLSMLKLLLFPRSRRTRWALGDQHLKGSSKKDLTGAARLSDLISTTLVRANAPFQLCTPGSLPKRGAPVLVLLVRLVVGKR